MYTSTGKTGGVMPKYQYKRSIKTLLIDPQMQKEYTLLLVVLIIVAAIVISFIVNWTIRESMLSGPYRLGKLSPYEVMSSINYLLTVRITLALLVTIFVAGFLSIKFLHRVGGPIYRFRVTLRQISSGQIPNDIHLRRSDFYKDVADEMNRVLALMRNKRESAQKLASELERIPPDRLPSDVSQNLNRLISELKKV